MAKLSEQEKAYNDWWMSLFDNKHYKVICLFNHHEKLQEYTTANADYSDEEDARDAYWTGTRFGLKVTSVTIDGTRFKQINGKIRRISNG